MGLLDYANTGTGRSRGLLGGVHVAPRADAIDEWFLRQQAAREAQSAQPAPMPQAAPQAPAPSLLAPPQRERVSGWRLLDRVLGGQTVSEGLDAERARLQAEAMRPQLAAQQQATLATLTDPTERALFLQAPDVWAENAGYRLRPRTLAPGSVERINGQTVGGAPVVERFDDRFGVFDPMNPGQGAQYTDPRGPTFDEVTGRGKAEADAALANQRLVLDSQKAQVDATVGLGNLGVNQSELALKQAQAAQEAGDTARAEGQQANAVIQTAQNMAGALQRSREFVRAAGVWSQYNPLNRQARANLAGNLDTLKGNLTFDKLMEMKRNSPTGASGLGALSDNEARLLASTAAALNEDMSPQELERSFQVIDGLIAKMQQSGAAQGGIVDVSSPQEAAALPPGTQFRANGRVYIRE